MKPGKFLLVLLTGLVLLVPARVICGDKKSATDPMIALNYPEPPLNERSLFYIQRSKNTNAIMYELNLDEKGKVVVDEPVKVFWIRYATDSTTADLTYIQKKYAYGLNAVPVLEHKDQYVLNFVSYGKKKIYLFPDPETGKYKAYTSINGKMAQLKKVFIRINGGAFWFPNIEDIELSGLDPATKVPVVEHFKP